MQKSTEKTSSLKIIHLNNNITVQQIIFQTIITNRNTNNNLDLYNQEYCLIKVLVLNNILAIVFNQKIKQFLTKNQEFKQLICHKMKSLIKIWIIFMGNSLINLKMYF